MSTKKQDHQVEDSELLNINVNYIILHVNYLSYYFHCRTLNLIFLEQVYLIKRYFTKDFYMILLRLCWYLKLRSERQ